MPGTILATALAAKACAALAGQAGVDHAMWIAPAPEWRLEVAQRSYNPLPVTRSFCRVEGRIEGNIGYELWLPAEWNGRLLGAGVGGDAGIYNYSDLSRRVNEGFAAVTSDAGHKIADVRWMANAKMRVDYEHRAVHLSAVAAKALVAQFYGRAQDRSYFLGCSGGGRQALKELQNYPADYDGIVAGAPGPYMPLISVRMMWSALLQKHDPAGALSDGDWALYEAAATNACDAQDGVPDGIVENPLACHVDTAALLCKPGQADACLTAPKLAMLDRIVAPMPDESGRPMDKGLLPGVRTRPGPPSPLLRAMWADGVYDDPEWDEDGFRRTADLNAANRAMPELRADKTAIAPFIARGGKAVLYQGWADPSVIAGPTVDYYRALAAANGGTDRLKQSVRMFMVPGMYHCRGGPGADGFGGSGQTNFAGDASRDILWATIRWVEAGKAPDTLDAARPALDGLPAVTRKLCAFPASAVPLPGKDHDSAQDFTCRADALLAKR